MNILFDKNVRGLRKAVFYIACDAYFYLKQ